MATTETIGVLALQGDTEEHLRVLASLGVLGRPVRGPADLDTVGALILPGGESTTMAKLAARYDLLDPLRKRIADGMPTYGTCAGMILLADRLLDAAAGQRSLGGIDMTVRRNAFGRQTESFEAPVEIAALDGGPVDAVFIRAPWVESLGSDVTALGHVTTGPHTGRVVAVRQRHLLATAFHPELTGDTRIHQYFVEMVREQR
ncbi:pyridoxal 5'-phosphate synthase glutaminase subunit PdxT [Spiractinospora alimapuensis]|uniref:pyridoxal 5'-phosphate synthase glutaminase subunit PdxT n=1 Tax=Spiractinospora alimapuensis TaxID=2820884 RepID=UPI001EEC9019|nr:pyridoxal 5'-phosphate synthase glutaminase subunit PdxT [Spiractinospora alimapuensis]QVQ51842.1 pyridoxal 5'-phosphate synthase glutaminase subunit PdxT [Spiractinospora alimapuensis]